MVHQHIQEEETCLLGLVLSVYTDAYIALYLNVVVVVEDGEPEYDREARGKLAAAGLTSDEEEGQGGASGYDTDSPHAESGAAARDAEQTASKGQKQRKQMDKPSRSRSKSRERSTKGTPRLKKRAREPSQPGILLTTVCFVYPRADGRSNSLT